MKKAVLVFILACIMAVCGGCSSDSGSGSGKGDWYYANLPEEFEIFPDFHFVYNEEGDGTPEEEDKDEETGEDTGEEPGEEEEEPSPIRMLYRRYPSAGYNDFLAYANSLAYEGFQQSLADPDLYVYHKQAEDMYWYCFIDFVDQRIYWEQWEEQRINLIPNRP